MPSDNKPYKYESLKDGEWSRHDYNDQEQAQDSRQRSLVTIPFRHLVRVTVSLPLVAFLFNIFYSLYVDFEKATNTLCSDHRTISNYLPSFSAVIGLFNFPSSLWHISIALHAAPRFLFVVMTYSFLESVITPKYHIWNCCVLVLGMVENIGLILLTYVSSRSNFPVHMWSFISFILASEFYMLIYCLLLKKCRSIPATSRECKSLRVKLRLMIFNVGSALLSAIVYYRHVTYCEVGVYTLFAFLEYVVVLTNMGYHASAYWDFYDRNLVI